VVDSALDVLIDSGGVDTVFTPLAFTLAAGFENLTLTGGETVAGTGNSLANTITGNNAANTLAGGGGNDSLVGLNGNDLLNGGVGADTMVGGLGADRYVVDNALDVVIENAGEGTDQVLASIAWTLGDNFENLQLTGTANLDGTGNDLVNRLAGNEGANLLRGLGGNDNLLGAGGADTLDGGAGRDALTGGAGADMFLFGNPADGPDKVVDFAPGVDVLAFVAASFGGLPPGPLGAANFVAHASYNSTSAAGVAQFIYHTGVGVLCFDANGGGGPSTRVATLIGAPAVALGDLLMIA
jgi:Ca2+-binding RTX toxin-like protein